MTLVIILSLLVLAFACAGFEGLGGGVVRDYECVKCNAVKNPKTYVPMQDIIPRCPRCGEHMTEFIDG